MLGATRLRGLPSQPPAAQGLGAPPLGNVGSGSLPSSFCLTCVLAASYLRLAWSSPAARRAVGHVTLRVSSFAPRQCSCHAAMALRSAWRRFTSEMMSTMRRLVSSGRHSSLQRLPASMWKMGMCRRLAPMTLRQLLVSPSTSTASGFTSTINFDILFGVLDSLRKPFVSPFGIMLLLKAVASYLCCLGWLLSLLVKTHPYMTTHQR